MTAPIDYGELAERLARLEAGQVAIMGALESITNCPKDVAVLQMQVKALEIRATAAGVKLDKIVWWIAASGGAGAAGGHALTRVLGGG